MSNGNDPVLQYHFDEESGATVYDSSPQGLHAQLAPFLANGTQVLAPTRTAGRMSGPALMFDGKSQLNVGDKTAFDITSFTMMAWIWYTWNSYPNANEARQEVMEKADTYWMNVRRNSKALRVGYMNCAGKISRTDSTIPIPETTNTNTPIWTHVAATLENNTLKIYINGVEDVPARLTNLTSLPCVTNHPLIIGGRFTPLNSNGTGLPLGPDALFKGAIDEFRLYPRALTENEIQSLLADVYIRDNLSDTGVEPLPGGGISMSPDINHYPDIRINPQAELGNSAAEGQGNLFEPIEVNQSNYIYIRLQNRGIMPANADVDIYWTPASTLPSPNIWNLIGSIPVNSISPGEFKVAGPLEWPQEDIPGIGHYCFIAVLGNAAEPKPNLNSISDINDFLKIIRGKNNVTWKNFEVTPQGTNSQKRIYFDIRGWRKHAYQCDLVVNLLDLPANCKTELKVLKRLTKGAIIDGLTTTSTSKLYTYFSANPSKTVSLKNMPLKASDRSKASLFISIPEDMPDGAYDVAIMQRINNHEMGRITTRMLVGTYPFVANRSSKEVHKRNCEWAKKISPKNKVFYNDVHKALQHGYNGCHTCLLEYDTG